MSGNLLATYRWLADGTKVGVADANETGFDYIGSLIYRRNGDDLELESTGFGGGRIVVSEGSSGAVYTPNYFLTDHLGSTRAIVSHTGEVFDRSDYYPYGLKWEHPGAQASDNRWLYNGKELQTAGISDGSNYLDYGARMYLPRIARLITPDPLAGLMAGSTPYGYCLGNPIRYIDFMGLAPDTPPTYNGGTLPTIYINGTGCLQSLDLMYYLSLKEMYEMYGLNVSEEDNTQTREWEYYLPVWGSLRMSQDSWRNKLYFDSTGWFFVGVFEAFSLGLFTQEMQGAKSAAMGAGRTTAARGVASTGFRSFTRDNFRYNLGKLTGKIPANSQAHHVFPVKWSKDFAKAGINIHDPKFGVWWETSAHLKNASAYNAKWDVFFFHNSNPTSFQIMNHGRSLMLEQGIHVGF